MQHVAAMRQSASSLHQRVTNLSSDVHPKMLRQVLAITRVVLAVHEILGGSSFAPRHWQLMMEV